MANLCEPCTENAVCKTKNILPKPGYILPNKNAKLVVRCFNYEACLGVNYDEKSSEKEPSQDEEIPEGLYLKNCNEGYNKDSFMCADCE